MNSMVHVIGFAGSLRRDFYNKAVLRAAAELLPAGMSLETVDLAPIPLYNADLEAEDLPQSVADFKARLAAADALLIVTPEYNYSVPGVLKNTIDWGVAHAEELTTEPEAGRDHGRRRPVRDAARPAAPAPDAAPQQRAGDGQAGSVHRAPVGEG